MTPAELLAAMFVRLDATDLSAVFDGEPTSTPTGPYACVYDDPGLAAGFRYSTGSDRLSWTVRVVCAGFTRDGMREAVRWTRAALTDQYLDSSPSASALEELAASQDVTDGPLGDRRSSQTLTYRMHTATYLQGA